MITISAADFNLSLAFDLQQQVILVALQRIAEAVTTIAEAAARTTDNVNSNMEKMTNTVSRVANLFAGFFNDLASQSPDVQVALALIDLEFEQMYITLGEKFAPFLETVVIPLVENFTDIIANLSPEVTMLIGIFSMLMASITVLIPIVLALNVAISPIGLAVIAIVAAVSLLLLAWTQNFGGIQDITMAMWAQLEPTFAAFVDALSLLWNTFMLLLEIVEPILSVLFIMTMATFTSIVQGVLEILTIFITAIADTFGGIFKIIKGIFTLDFPLVFEGFIQLLKGLIEFVQLFFVALSEIIVIPIRAIVYTLLGIWTMAGDEIMAFFTGLVSTLTGFGDTIISIWGDVWDFLDNTGKDIIDWVLGTIEDQTKGILGMLKKVVNFFIDLLNVYLISPVNEVIQALKDFEIGGFYPFSWIPIIPDLPTFHSGGLVEGNDDNVPIIAQSGEWVLNRSDVDLLGGPQGVKQLLGAVRGGRSTGRMQQQVMNNYFTINVTGGSNSQETAREIQRAIERVLEKQSQRRAKF